jgi:glycosyltransferase involved in cell wall biosynthesis
VAAQVFLQVAARRFTGGREGGAMIRVSAIIPTRHRPELLERAIRSVLAQTFEDFEVIVVIDGPDGETRPDMLRAMSRRIQVVSLAKNVGLAEARNEGIRRARGRWVALLDDDDEWLPEKLELQVAAAEKMKGEYIFVPCKFIEKTLTLERVMPAKLPGSATNFSEYMYCEQGYLQPSMFFMSRALCMEVRFTRGLRHVEDSDWLLRAMRHPGIQLGGVDRALSIYYNYKNGERESETTPWEKPLKWAVENHALFTRRAFPFYVARIGVNAKRAGEPISVLFYLVRTASKYGSLNAKSLTYFFAYWFFPERYLKRVRMSSRRERKVLVQETL